MRLLWRLRDDEAQPGRAAIVERVEAELAAQYGAVEDVFHAEHQRQATQQAAVSNTITSMRLLSGIDWADWFERVSRVEQVLRQDPNGVYAGSTFPTRDRYRHEVERLARRTGLAEHVVAQRLVATANRGVPDATRRESHIGYYLIGAGQRAFERQLGYRVTLGESIRRIATSHPSPLYLGALTGGTAALVAVTLSVAGSRWRARSVALAGGLLLVPGSEVVEEALNWCLSRALPPRALPRLDLSRGIPAEFRTIVAPVAGKRERPAGATAGTAPGERRPAPALRVAERFRRRARGDDAGRRGGAFPCDARNRKP